jgi:beta-glucosidase
MWGTATSAHQVEGNNRNNDWWEFEQRPGAIWHGDKSGDACGWWRDPKADFDLAARMGQNSHRLSVEWSRIEPEEGVFDPGAIARYRKIIRALKERGLEPMVTLHHFTTPLWMADQGGWTNDHVIEHFGRFVRHTVAALSDLVQYWCTINEPAVYATEAYVLGIHAPGGHGLRSAFQVLRNMLLAHGIAYELIHKLQEAPQVGLAKNIRLFDPASDSALDQTGARLLDWFFNEIVLRALNKGRLVLPLGWQRLTGERFPLGPLDYIGLNYYTRDRVRFDPSASSQMFLRRSPTPGAEISDHGREGPYGEIYPEGLYRALHKVARFNRPIYITETGLPDADDRQRPHFILSHLAQVHRAISERIPIKGFYFWSLLDNFEWSEGWALKFGLNAFDPVTKERHMRQSGKLYSEICHQNAITANMVRRYAPELLGELFPKVQEYLVKADEGIHVPPRY